MPRLRPRSPRLGGVLAAVTALLVLTVSTHALQGDVISAVKISETSGGFGVLLDDQDQFGRAVADLGDLDGNGFSDLVVGAQGDDDGGADNGSVYVLFMGPNGIVTASQKISDFEGGLVTTLDAGDQFGRAVGNLGDVDGDGVTDIAVGANFDDDGGPNQGAVYILFLNADGTVKGEAKISDSTGGGGFPGELTFGEEFGRAIAPLGDLDGDSVPDMAVGSYDSDEASFQGAVYVFFLNTDGTVKAFQKISQTQGGFGGTLEALDRFGHSVANLGDFSGDGVVDLIVGSPLDKDGGVNRGAVWGVFLNTDGTVNGQFLISDTQGGLVTPLDDIDQFGIGVASVGDLDLDGVTDIAVGAVKDDDGGSLGQESDVGATYILFLNADGTVKSEQKISSTEGNFNAQLNNGDWFGSSLGTLGSLPADPPFQLAVGARFDDDGGSNHGAIYLLQLNDGTLSAPNAEFMGDVTSGPAPLTVSFTDLSTGDVTSWLWNFSDPPVGLVQNPVHTFSNPGTYDVRLTVSGPAGTNSEDKFAYITVTAAGPTADFSGTPTSGDAPLAVAFSDLSVNGATGWSWDFGDGGMSTAQNPSHTYSSAGFFTVSLSVTSATGSDAETKVDYVTVGTPAPVAEFSADPTAGLAPLTVAFTDLSSGDVTSFAWDFGDGGMSTAQDPSHQYAAVGDYTVSLTVTGAGGSDLESKTDLVSVAEPAPVAEFSGTPTSGPAPLTVVFTDLSTGSVSAYAWDFGDGGMSTAQNPSHEYAAVGDYTVSLTVTGAGGSDLESKVGYVSVAEPAPVAEFSGTPLSGFEPLTVAFADLSTGSVTSWAWDFGDGGMSTAQNPSHEYTAAGDYSVSLTVTGIGGSDLEIKTDWVSVSPLPVFADGSFEGQTAGGLPTTPWSVSSGTAHVIQPVGLGADNGLPSDGAQWVELAADGTDSATPPSNPGGAGTAPVGAAGIEQSFTFDAGMPFLVFEAAFLLDGLPSDPTFNDFLSVDVTDGTTTHNLLYRDSFSALPNTSAIHGLAMTDTETVASDLAALFPAATSSTVLTVSFQVGNVGDALQPSKGYLDHVRFAPAALATSRNGTAVNPVCFTSTSPPAIGTTWTTAVDSTAVSNPGFVALLGYDAALIPGLVIPEGELLVDTTANFLFYDLLVSGGGADVFAKPIPADPSFEGFFASVQAVVLGDTVVLCNAVDVTLGY